MVDYGNFLIEFLEEDIFGYMLFLLYYWILIRGKMLEFRVKIFKIFMFCFNLNLFNYNV